MAARADPLTPLFRQYWEIKNQYPDVILMFRLGDFYEMFGEDAREAAEVLEITLTSREYVDGERIPMCGVPYHAVERYVARLIAAGRRVALCDQMEDARFAKGIVRRKVTRVVTPGTVTQEAMLEARANNYLVGVTATRPELQQAEFGLAVCDVSTGEFAVTELRGPEAWRRLQEELHRLAPKEMVVPESQAPIWDASEVRPPGATVSPLPPASGSQRDARAALLRHFGVQSLRGFGCEELELAVDAAAAVLRYLQHRHLEGSTLLRSLSTYDVGGYLGLDAAARRNLEITSALGGGRGRTLLSVVDQSRTAMGGRMLRRWLERPLADPEPIRRRLDAVEALAGSALLRGDLRECLGGFADMERLAGRAATGSASPRDLAALRASLRLLPALAGLLAGSDSAPLTELAGRIEPLDDVVDLLESALVEEPPAQVRDGGVIRAGYSTHLDEIRRASTEGKEWIAGLEASERERTGIKSLKIGFNSVFGYYLEVTRPNLHLVPPDYHRKQTTANGERFFTPELKEREAQILGADERILEMEARLFTELRERVGREAPRILRAAAVAAETDALAAFAETSARRGYVRPELDESDEIEIIAGRHPVVEDAAPTPFVPNDVRLDTRDQRLLIITGPNMAGKSTYLRQTALIVLLAQAGCFVPADRARIGIVDRIFTRIGAHDDLATGQSTFMVEMNETACILNNATERSLVILDEIGRGTSTFDGLSIAWAVAEHLHELRARTLFATHYHHLNDLAERLAGVKNYRAAVREDSGRVVWLHKIVPGGTDKSYGIQVARLAGLPESVIGRAREVLADLESLNRRGEAAAPPKGAKIQEKRQSLQLTLFDLNGHPVVDALRGMDLSTMTPIEALTALYRLQKEAAE